MTKRKMKYYDNPIWNAAFERCVDVLAELIEKYANRVLFTHNYYQAEYTVMSQENIGKIFIAINYVSIPGHLKRYVEFKKVP